MNNIKICKVCNNEKSVDFFYKNHTYKDGFSNFCKKCTYERNKNKAKEYRIKNKEVIKLKNTEYRSRPEVKKRTTVYLENNREKASERSKRWLENNKEYKRNKDKEYRQKNKEKIKQMHKEYGKKNREKINTNLRNRRKEDPLYRTRVYLTNRLCFFLRGRKSKSSLKIIGADLETVKKHIERQFKKGMSWDNQGEWHIDHKIPVSSGKTVEEIEKLCHYTNLQPLWAKDNLSKNNKIIETQMVMTI